MERKEIWFRCRPNCTVYEAWREGRCVRMSNHLKLPCHLIPLRT
jgi:hypothetical protein